MVRVSRLPQGNKTESNGRQQVACSVPCVQERVHTHIHLLTILKGNTASKRRAGVNPSLSGFMVCGLSIKSGLTEKLVFTRDLEMESNRLDEEECVPGRVWS